jgi:DNA polymerase-1
MKPIKTPPTLYLIDVSSFIFRAFFAIRALHNRRGEPTHAVYGVMTMLARLIQEKKPEYLAVIYDSPEPSFRKDLYPQYKSQRSAPAEDLISQFPKIKSLIKSFQIPTYEKPKKEADDLIATLTQNWSSLSNEHQVVIVSSDKDLMQLVTNRVIVLDTMHDKSYGPSEVQAKFGVLPSQMRDYLALVGDASDSIPGVPGVGPKTASAWLKENGTLEAILDLAEKGKITGTKGSLLQEHAEKARLSAKLVTLVTVPLVFSEQSLRYQFHLTSESVEILQDLGLKSLLSQWKSYIPEGSLCTSQKSFQGKTIADSQALETLLTRIRKRGLFSLDLETTSLNPRQAQLVGIAIGIDTEAWYIPLGHAEGVQLAEALPQLRPILEDPKVGKIGQNIKYDASVLEQQDIALQGVIFDTMIAAYLLNPGERCNLKALAEKYFDYEMLTYEQVCGKGKKAISFDQVSIPLATRYSAEDAWMTWKLWEVLKPQLETQNLMPLFLQVELPLIPILVHMELQGVCIHEAWLQKLSSQWREEMQAIEAKIQTFVPPKKRPLNLNSSQQLASFLFEDLQLPVQSKTKTGFSTEVSVLEALAPLHEVVEFLLQYRELSKLIGTYVDPLVALKDPQTKKIHTSFHQAVVSTGRLSSSDPNLQNIPIKTDRGIQIRKAFIPSPGCVLVSADYSQVELRILAHMSQDPALVASFHQDEDVHQKTASELFEIKLEEVDEKQRRIAKAINFGLMYGKTAFGLAQELKISRKQAKEMIDRYFQRYSGVKAYFEEIIKKAEECGYVSSLLGRKRWLPDIQSQNQILRNNAQRMAMNTPIQSTAADLIKLAMIQIQSSLQQENLKAQMILQVHDELVLDCPEHELAQIKKLLTEVMEHAMELLVPLKVQVSSGIHWMEL